MKKIIAVPVVAVIAAVGAASAAGFAGGFSAAPIQSGDATNLTCADSARVVEWGTNDDQNPPFVDTALVRLDGSTCQGQAVSLIALKPDGTQYARFGSKRLDSSLASGTQYIRLNFVQDGFPAGTRGVPVENLNAVRVTVDGGYPNMTVGGSNTN